MSNVPDLKTILGSFPDITDPAAQARLKELEQEFKISTALHPDDYMFRFHYNFGHGVDLYFRSGYEDAHHISWTIKEVLPNVSQPKVLEFASGYGRVSRHLQNALPGMDLTMCDVHSGAVEFARESLGIKSAKSEPLPSKFRLDANSYDFVFALSFFSHIRDEIFADWLLKLYSLVRPGGMLMFSTHGETSMEVYDHLKQGYNPTFGYGYRQESEQLDLDTETYGLMSVDFEYVVRQIRKTPGKIVRFRAGCWWGHQDEWVIQKPANP
jgi:2-polyprenyl-3-methyl-5-hydroxy-6-metoxy-1,4-benzoquinol methylase